MWSVLGKVTSAVQQTASAVSSKVASSLSETRSAFHAEQAKVAELERQHNRRHRLQQSIAGLAPWAVFGGRRSDDAADDDDADEDGGGGDGDDGGLRLRLKEKVLALSKDERTFTVSVGGEAEQQERQEDAVFPFEMDVAMPFAVEALKEDAELEKARFRLTPHKVSEELFWRRYFYRVSLVREELGVEPLHLGSAEQILIAAGKPDALKDEEEEKAEDGQKKGEENDNTDGDRKEDAPASDRQRNEGSATSDAGSVQLPPTPAPTPVSVRPSALAEAGDVRDDMDDEVDGMDDFISDDFVGIPESSFVVSSPSPMAQQPSGDVEDDDDFQRVVSGDMSPIQRVQEDDSTHLDELMEQLGVDTSVDESAIAADASVAADELDDDDLEDEINRSLRELEDM